jgi:cytochrome c
MTCRARISTLLGFTSAFSLVFSVTVYADVDAAAAKSLARKSDCFKCHAVDKDKDGPAYHKVAEKYRGKAEAEAKLIHHVTAGEKVKFPDGHEDEHKIVKTENMDEIKNLVDWILSL